MVLSNYFYLAITRYLSMPSTRKDLTQGHFIVGVREGEFTHEPRLMHCWTMMVVGSLGTMWTMLAFAKSPSTYAR